MKILLSALALLILAGCASAPLTPTTVNPTATDATNALMCLIRAQNGDCAAPCPVPPAGSACAYLDRNTATLNDDLTAIAPCAMSAGQQPVVAAVAGIQTTLCVKAGKAVGTVTPAASVTVPPATAIGPAGH